jgi:hypothetical protein
MRYSIRFSRLLAAGIVAAVTAVGPLAQVAPAEPAGPDVPSTIAVGDGFKVFMVGHAAGVQVYSCGATSTGYAWSFVAPRADLYGDNGQLVATHFGGPTWQARDGSTVRAKRDQGVTVDPTAIPWLLLSKDSVTAGPDGDRLTGTAFIQRTATTGGLAPAAAECNAGSAGDIVEVPYTADYWFWKSTAG